VKISKSYAETGSGQKGVIKVALGLVPDGIYPFELPSLFLSVNLEFGKSASQKGNEWRKVLEGSVLSLPRNFST